MYVCVYVCMYVCVCVCVYVYIYIYIYIYIHIFFLWRCDPKRVMASSFLRFLDHTQRRTTVGRSDQLVAETSTWQHTTLTTDRYPCPGGIRTHDLSRRAIADLCLRPSGHWDRHGYLSVVSVVCCQVEVSATSWSLVQRSPTDCAASLCVI